ncbi:MULTISPECIES: 1,4-alpha-glucan branching protein GlgB [Dietzia]|uniref:1,4-alpha-glucan branching enzyme GlgB n=7 Tax=Dietzia cinnamea TaxID=321318 RepID=A0A4R3ZRN1_9ACTN|nr:MULTISPECIES: 1,4-alpha-glucan branching protein GlgB [Dietzia]MCT1639022.1 1,4-alpha-glucan branching protein GlgB [Dietzia cinnamea]MCT2122108.1 1,4-alpha-glucan branching protein GlgB [Dietzia cinnamea]MCT2145775.1 1,4-alpha-glucan branching protein GlgB [Dietzia cinnamea]MCT2305554.1 1,4-alpha-glucan branching protein GlgB [Dietzia cinnamea]TCW22821.1 1,4-alpha-glucan branching enzyme [Dietzia cinnamea]
MGKHKKQDPATARRRPEKTSSSSPSSPAAPATPGPAASPAPAAAPHPTPLTDEVLGRLRAGTHHDPHSVYGTHRDGDGSVVRTMQPGAVSVEIDFGDRTVPMEPVSDGLFQAALPEAEVPDYRYRVAYADGHTRTVADGYRFLPTLGEVDLHLIGEGRHERLWDVLGAHVRTYDSPGGPVTGTSFAVWAPNARGVSVVGDFCGWNPVALPMRSIGSSGVWELFVPDVGDGAVYKYRVRGADGRTVDHADPMAVATEVPPATASKVFTSAYEWNDDEWIAARATRDHSRSPMTILEVHVGSWRPGLDYREFAHQLAEHVLSTGFTHVELMPVAEHPFGGSWGYQVSGYFAPTSRFGSPDDLRYVIDHLHSLGIGVLVDWVPAHFPKDEWSLGRFDGTPLYEHGDPRRGEQPDWGTYVFDFGRREVRNFLVANALYWADEFHVDGLRVDAVASMLYLDYSRDEGQWTPNIHGGRENLEAISFLQEVNATVHRKHPGVLTVAEESTSWGGVTAPTYTGGLGFSMKWNMGWMNDTLQYVGLDPIYRGYHHGEITFSLMYAWSERFVLPLSHDEVVHGKGSMWERMPGSSWDRAAGIRSLYAYMWAHPGKKLLFQGLEFGQTTEWNAERGVAWDDLEGWEGEYHRGIRDCVRDLNARYAENPGLWALDDDPSGFSWIDANDSEHNTLSFLRTDHDGSTIACVVNFSGAPLGDYRIGLPEGGYWEEILNTDAEAYEGSGAGNYGGVHAEQISHHGRPYSAAITVGSRATVWFRHTPTG